ncbi:hypothetical protein F3Y22_tig00003435pilonHSYRG00045 [Hibiscus syriacus]|uniref:RRM domain-containing protein n=1 Tax=Hibiscus syriacus TaxID=106335 RepID=A0A6A3CMB9_HIBSY|nr:hypothetical protein F3Y22_tig00003435pilonHSYRG00045 [Hibiscus syriacus]
MVGPPMETVVLFVDYLPNSIHWKGLWQVVGRYGEVLSGNISKKRSRAGTRFGFVKVSNWVEAKRVRERLNGLMVYGSRISVRFAKYMLKDQKEKCLQSELVWKSKIASSTLCEKTQSMMAGQEGASRKEVVGHVDEDEVRKLRRCLVGVMAGVCSVGSIVGRLQKWGLGEIRVQRLRGKSFLLTIEDEDLFIMLEDLQWSYLKEIFVDVMLWIESLCQKERVVWIEIDGLPLHCWNEITLKRLVGLWGTFEAYGENVKHQIDCEKVNMLISTSLVARIDEVVEVVVDNMKFGVRVLEVGMVDHSVAKLSKNENYKIKENGDMKVGVDFGAVKEGLSSEKNFEDTSDASSSGSSYDIKGATKNSGSAINVLCSGDILGDCRNDSVGKSIAVGCGSDEGRESVDNQFQNHSIQEYVQGVGDVGVETMALCSNAVYNINEGGTSMEAKAMDEGDFVGAPEVLMDLNCERLLASGEKHKRNSDITKNSKNEQFGGDFVEDSVMPEIYLTKNKNLKKYGSLLDIQDKVLSKAEIRKRNRALKRKNLKKSDLIYSELSGRSLSDSDLKRKWADATVEVEKTLSLGKILGINFVGSKREILKDLASLELN